MGLRHFGCSPENKIPKPDSGEVLKDEKKGKNL